MSNASNNVYLISSLLDSGKEGYLDLKQAQITSSDLDKDSAQCLKFINDYYEEYQDVPTRTVFKEQFGIDLPFEPGKINFWIDQIVKRRITDQAFAAVQNFGNVARDDIHAGIKHLDDFLSYYRMQKRGLQVLKPAQIVDKVIQKYMDAKQGIMGIPTPWEKMDDWTQGWNPGNLAFFGARTGRGKTFLTILALRSAIKSQLVKTALYASGEMFPEVILQRYAVIDHKISYETVRKGKIEQKLGPFQEKAYLNYLDTVLREMDQIQIVDVFNAKGGFSLANLEHAIQLSNPQILIVDAAYMMKLEKEYQNQSQAMGKIAEGLKELSGKYNLATIATTQLNRASLQKESVDDSDFALSDQIAWNSDFMFILSQSDEQFANRIMEIKPVKIREGANDRSGLKVSWCFDRMDFKPIDDDPNDGGGSKVQDISEARNRRKYDLTDYVD